MHCQAFNVWQWHQIKSLNSFRHAIKKMTIQDAPQNAKDTTHSKIQPTQPQTSRSWRREVQEKGQREGSGCAMVNFFVLDLFMDQQCRSPYASRHNSKDGYLYIAMELMIESEMRSDGWSDQNCQESLPIWSFGPALANRVDEEGNKRHLFNYDRF